MVTVGGTVSRVTVLSVLVEAALALPAASCATPADREALTGPSLVIPLTATLYVVPLPVTIAVVAPAVPVKVTSPASKFITGLLNTAVKFIGDAFVGSACPLA